MRRALLAVVLTAALLGPTSSSLFDPLWPFFSSLWGTSADAGCEMDPDGQCQPQPDAGCEADPNGRCLPAS